MNRIAAFAVGAIVLLALGCAPVAVQPSSVPFDELMHKSGLWRQLAEVEPMMLLGVTEGNARTGHLADEDLAQLRKAIASSYGADRLRATVRRELAALLVPQDTTQILDWLSSDLGRRITLLEDKGAEAEAFVVRQKNAAERMATLPPARRGRIERLLRATFSAEAAATLVIDTTAGIAQGLAIAKDGAGGNVMARVKSELEARRDEMVKSLQQQITADAAAIYAPLSDSELDRYIAFAESDVGRRYSAASLTALDQALTDAAVELGRQLGQKTTSPRVPAWTVAASP